jgi:hypothetical protein
LEDTYQVLAIPQQNEWIAIQAEKTIA